MQSSSATWQKGLKRFGRRFFAVMLALPIAYVAWHTVGRAQEAAVLAPPPAVDSSDAASGGEETARAARKPRCWRAVVSGGCRASSNMSKA